MTELGGRFSLELGIDVDRHAAGIDRWALAAALLGSGAPASVALRTYRVLERAGAATLTEVRRRDRDELVSLLDAGGYARWDESTASRLLVLADAVVHRYPGGLSSIGERIAGQKAVERELNALPGWDRATVKTFLRELRGAWPGVQLELDPRAVLAARHAALPTDLDGLVAVAAVAHLDLRDLEAGLVRLALCHDFEDCPGGEECPFVQFDREQFVHF